MARQHATIAVSLIFFCYPGAATALEAGDPAPPFDAKLLGADGRLELNAYRGKVVYLDFWASWCPPCLISLPLLESLRGEFPEAEFQIVAVNLDTDSRKALRFLDKIRVGYPSAADPDGRIPASYGLATMPTSYLIDADGVIRHVHEGFRKSDVDALRERIRRLIAAGGR
jgi:thiol-disulfide isomerase/thioredoxin